MLAALETAPITGPFVELRTRLIERWAALDPQGAWTYARNVPSSSGSWSSREAAGRVLRRWAIADPLAALQSWRELKLSDSNSDRYDQYRSDFYGLADLFSRLGRQNMEQALVELQTLLPDQKEAAWKALAGLAGREEFRERILTALTALPQGEARAGALAQALTSWKRSVSNVEPVWQWLDSAQLARSDMVRIEERLWADEFFNGQREAASDWLLARARSPKERGDRMETAVMNWASGDPVACANWLNRQGLDDTASRAMAVFARTAVANHPEDAVAWARRIPDPAVRQRSLEEVEKRLRVQYPNRADALLVPAPK
jgi:hypothetical protein